MTACPAEKSGQKEFDFEYGKEFARHIDAFDPTFCKVLGRYNPEGDRFAVGRTTFWDAVLDWKANSITRDAAITEIARRYREWVDIFQQATCSAT